LSALILTPEIHHIRPALCMSFVLYPWGQWPKTRDVN